MINFSTVEIKFDLKKKLKLRSWIKSIATAEGKSVGDITYVFCSDEYLGNMNEKYLKHHTLTDIITFDSSEKNSLAGDICISIERVKENAQSYGASFNEELGRVMAHGILHLAGYKDKSAMEKQLMREKENFYLSSYPNT